MLGAIIQVLISGFIIGALARWAVPGPDPMSVPMTILLGVFGSFLGGGIAAVIFGAEQDSGSVFAILIGSIVASMLLLIGYRRFVRSADTGPGHSGRRPRPLRDTAPRTREAEPARRRDDQPASLSCTATASSPTRSSRRRKRSCTPAHSGTREPSRAGESARSVGAHARGGTSVWP